MYNRTGSTVENNWNYNDRTFNARMNLPISSVKFASSLFEFLVRFEQGINCISEIL